MHCAELAKFITDTIGHGWKKDATKLEYLLDYIDDDAVLDKMFSIKHNNKVALAKCLKETDNVDIDVNSIFDVQIKRLHEYKASADEYICNLSISK